MAFYYIKLSVLKEFFIMYDIQPSLGSPPSSVRSKMVLLMLSSVSQLLIKTLSPGVQKKNYQNGHILRETEVKCPNTVQGLL